MDEPSRALLDTHVPAPLGNDVDSDAQPHVDAIEQPISGQQARGPNRSHAPRTDIQSEDLFHLVTWR